MRIEMRHAPLVAALLAVACKKPSSDRARADEVAAKGTTCVSPPARVDGALTIGGDCTLSIEAPLTVTATGNLVVAAGTRLVFAKNASLAIAGVLDVRGTADAPVTLTADAVWPGLELTGGSGSSIAHASIERADHVTIAPTTRTLSIASVTATVTTFSVSGDSLARFEVNAITGALSIDARSLDRVASTALSSPIHVTGTIDVTTSWPQLTVPIEVAGTLDVDDGGSLTIASGDVVTFARDAKLWVRGALHAERVTFRATTAKPGDWEGITIAAGTGPSFVECTIEDAALSLGVAATIERTTFGDTGAPWAIATTIPSDCETLYGGTHGNVAAGILLCNPSSAAAKPIGLGTHAPTTTSPSGITTLSFGTGTGEGKSSGTGPGAGAKGVP